MKLQFLGTSSGVPTPFRNVSSLALRLPQKSDVWLFDCGEATQHQLQRSNVSISQIKKIFISHLHGDHFFGLPGLLCSAGLSGEVTEITVYGPTQIKKYLNTVFEVSKTKFKYKLNIVEIEEDGVLFHENGFKVTTALLEHREVEAYGYRVEEDDLRGRFLVDKAIADGIPAGPIYKDLQKGDMVTLPDGRVINGAEYCGESRKGRVFVYALDTIFSKKAISLASNANLLVHEGTYSKSEIDNALKRGHSTVVDAANVAKEAGVEKLLITHISAKYSYYSTPSLKDLEKEAQEVFENSVIVKDYDEFEIEHPA